MTHDCTRKNRVAKCIFSLTYMNKLRQKSGGFSAPKKKQSQVVPFFIWRQPSDIPEPTWFLEIPFAFLFLVISVDWRIQPQLESTDGQEVSLVLDLNFPVKELLFGSLKAKAAACRLEVRWTLPVDHPSIFDTLLQIPILSFQIAAAEDYI